MSLPPETALTQILIPFFSLYMLTCKKKQRSRAPLTSERKQDISFRHFQKNLQKLIF